MHVFGCLPAQTVKRMMEAQDSTNPFSDAFDDEQKGDAPEGRSASGGSGAGKTGGAGAGNAMVIDVHPPELRKSTFSSYHVYKITTSPAIVEQVFRRYSEFEWLSKTLVAMFPCLFVPPLPPKALVGSKDEDFVNERKVMLVRFLNRIAKIPILADTPAFQMFVSRAFSFEEGMKEVEKDLKNITMNGMSHNVRRFYPDVCNRTVPDSVEDDMKRLMDFLVAEEENLTSAWKEAKELSLQHSKFLAQLGRLNVAVGKVYALEKGYQGVSLESRLTVTETFEQWHNDLKEADPSFNNDVTVNLYYDIGDVQTFISVLKRRLDVSKNYHGYTKPRAEKAAVTEPKDDKQRLGLEKDIENEKTEQEWLGVFNNMVLFHEVQTQWREKMMDFRDSMVRFGCSLYSLSSKSSENFKELKEGSGNVY